MPLAIMCSARRVMRVIAEADRLPPAINDSTCGVLRRVRGGFALRREFMTLITVPHWLPRTIIRFKREIDRVTRGVLWLARSIIPSAVGVEALPR